MYQRKLRQRKNKFYLLNRKSISTEFTSTRSLATLFEASFLDDLEIEYTPREFTTLPWDFEQRNSTPWAQAFAS